MARYAQRRSRGLARLGAADSTRPPPALASEERGRRGRRAPDERGQIPTAFSGFFLHAVHCSSSRPGLPYFTIRTSPSNLMFASSSRMISITRAGLPPPLPAPIKGKAMEL